MRDLDRSPIAIGAAQPWTRLTLRFAATRAEDRILLAAGSGGSFGGKAWVDGVSLDEAGFDDEWPAREAVKTFGPAYRYPAAGWICISRGSATNGVTSTAI